MRIETLVVGEFQVNCYIIVGHENHCLILDPGKDAETIKDSVATNGLTVSAYLLTHAHMDHISALADLLDSHPAPVACHHADWAWAFSAENAMPPFYPAPRQPESVEHRALSEGQAWRDAGLMYRIIETPGHSIGSVCFHFPEDNVLFSGDTLFAGSVGRTDLPGGDSRQLGASLEKLAVLPDETAIYCGHGPHTSLSQEKQTNFFMQRLPAGLNDL